MASSRPPSHAPSHDGGRRPRDMRAAIQRHDLSPSPSVKQQPEGYRAPSYLPPPYCPIRSDIYEKLSSPVGKGQFGAVWKCVNRRTRETCALKKVLMKNETEGFPLTALREIMLMSSLDHPNVLCLKEVVRSAPSDFNRQLGDVYMVFEYMEYDLAGLLNVQTEFSEPEIKCLAKQLFMGLHYLSTENILHRDLKTANVLLNRRGVLKIADFGLARHTQKMGKYTKTVCTRWYRPPELLLGERYYTTAIDVWSAACIVAELFTGVPVLTGGVQDATCEMDNDVDQFLLICKLCGHPTTWQGHDTMDNAPVMLPKERYPRRVRQRFEREFSVASPGGLEFLDFLLVMDPTARPTAQAALQHSFFWTDPMPCAPDEIHPLGEDRHDYTTPMNPKRLPKPTRRMKAPSTAAAAAASSAGSAVPPPPPPPPLHGPKQHGQGHHKHGNRTSSIPPPPPSKGAARGRPTHSGKPARGYQPGIHGQAPRQGRPAPPQPPLRGRPAMNSQQQHGHQHQHHSNPKWTSPGNGHGHSHTHQGQGYPPSRPHQGRPQHHAPYGQTNPHSHARSSHPPPPPPPQGSGTHGPPSKAPKRQ
eukprot:m.22052 g.22052  ORF g.22052 m.22052 type:complete len:587 (+) comp8345_c0_seq4:391-2151(+)